MWVLKMNNLKFIANEKMRLIEIYDERHRKYCDGGISIGYYMPNINYLCLWDSGHYISDIEQIIDYVKKEKNNDTTWGITYKVNGDDGYKELCDSIGKYLVIDDAITFLMNYHKKDDEIKIVKIEKIK